MKLTTPAAVEFLAHTDLANLPMLDELKFRLHFAKNAEQYLNAHVHIGYDEKSTTLCCEIEEAIYKNRYSFLGDDNFCAFTARDIHDFYIKILRRTVSIAYFSDLIGDCFDNHYTIEHNKLIELDNEAEVECGKKSDIKRKLETVDKCGNMLMAMTDNISTFDEECFDADILPYLQNPSKLPYPLNVELIRCSMFSTFVLEVE